MQSKFYGKAQEAIAALPIEDSLDYDLVKAAVLRTYELVPEAYRQKFRNHRKAPSQTYADFAREKAVLFDKWSTSCHATDFVSLRELVLLEEFKKSLPECLVIYLTEQKITTLSAAAIAADEYVLTHKTIFPSSPRTMVNQAPSVSAFTANPLKESRDCFYCHKSGHVIANCLALKRKEQAQSKPSQPPTKGVGFVSEPSPVFCNIEPVDDCFKPFLFEGFVSLNDSPGERRPVQILRDTACSQSVILSSVLPFSDQSSCGYSTELRGVEMGRVLKPVHNVYITSNLVNGLFPVAISSGLPIRGVDLLLGNDIAGGKVTPSLEVLDTPLPPESSGVGCLRQPLHPACVGTRSQARRNDDITLSDSFLMPAFSGETMHEAEGETGAPAATDAVTRQVNPSSLLLTVGDSSPPVSREGLQAAQEADPTLCQCYQSAVSSNKTSVDQVTYFIENGILMRKWNPTAVSSDGWKSVKQIVVPTVYRPHILSVAHESQWSGHLGITKTYNLVLRHFFLARFKN